MRHYIQSGNLVFKSSDLPRKLEAQLEGAIQRRFDLSIPVLVRAAATWPAYVAGNPFPDASQSEPNAVMLALSKSPPRPDAVEKLRERTVGGERITQAGEALYLHYQAGVASSKLAPGLIDRLVGSPVTMRNWRTVLKLHEMAAATS